MITVYQRNKKQSPTAGIYGKTSGLCVPGDTLPGIDSHSCFTGIDAHTIGPGTVVDSHSHRDTQILTYIVDGIVDYRDDAGNRHLLMGGEVQIVRAGDGITHSAGNASNSESLHVIQIWLNPDDTANDSHCEQRYFSDDARLDQFCLIASKDGRDGSLAISLDTDIHASVLRHEDPVMFQRKKDRMLWLQVARGTLRVNDTRIEAGDAAVVTGDADRNIRFRTESETEFLLLDLPGMVA